MRAKSLFLLIAVVLWPLFVSAHTPADITIDSGREKNQLRITVKHFTNNGHRDYIRKVEIIADDEQPIIKTFYFQVGNYRTVTVDIPDLDKVGKIIIRAYPRRGTFLEKEFYLNKQEEDRLHKEGGKQEKEGENGTQNKTQG